MLKLLSRCTTRHCSPVNFVDVGTFDKGIYSFMVLDYSGVERMTRLRVQARIRGTRHVIQFNATYDHAAHHLQACMGQQDLQDLLDGEEDRFDEYETLMAWQQHCHANLAVARGLSQLRAA